MNQQFLPVTMDEVRNRGWDAPDFVYVCGDAYVDHPSFGHAIIGRILEQAGYRVAMLCLPPWQDAEPLHRGQEASQRRCLCPRRTRRYAS